jgi:ribosomal protein L11 methyltransferase
VGRLFRIVPPGSPPVSGRTDIVMARGAFGSGEHETTASCLEVIEALPVRGARVLDVGSGTGILAIATLIRGAAHAVCVDVEARAVASARENAELNGVDERITHVCGVLADVPEGVFDLVLANIYGDLILDLAEQLVGRARRGATVVLSGILWEYNFPVTQRMERLGLRARANHMLDEYSTVVLDA